jgi:Zn-dependent protease
MQSSIPLGRIAGIPISANWSLIPLLALLVWQLDGVVFPATNPGLGSGAYLAMAVAAALVFAVSILAHEFGHALQARREGMTIHSITLWLFGGVARFEGFFPSGPAEIRVALAGPAVSVALGGALYGITRIGVVPDAPTTVIWWLAMINLLLGVFNMLPALPLDGGRTFRGIVWAVTGNLRQATRIAMQLSRVLAFLVIAAGIVLAVSLGDTVGGIWLAFIGVFILQAANIEGQLPVAAEAAAPGAHLARHPTGSAPDPTPDAHGGGVVARELMHPFPASVTPSSPIAHLIGPMTDAPPGTAYPVIADGEVQGLLVREVVLAVPADRVHDATAADLIVQRADLTVVGPDAPSAVVEQAVSDDRWGRALVVDDGVLVGFIGLQDFRRRPVTP